MKDYKVAFNDGEEMKNHYIKVKAMGIVPAIEEAQKKALDKFGLASLGWDIWKVEMI